MAEGVEGDEEGGERVGEERGGEEGGAPLNGGKSGLVTRGEEEQLRGRMRVTISVEERWIGVRFSSSTALASCAVVGVEEAGRVCLPSSSSCSSKTTS